MATSFATNIALSALPEIDQHKYPEIYAELVRMRNALHTLQGVIDILAGGTAGQQLTKNSATNFDVSWT